MTGGKKVYKNYGFARAFLILACDTTNEADKVVVYATKLKEGAMTSNKYAKNTQQQWESKDQQKQRKCGIFNNVTL